ncbi:MAG: Lrp/AsnC family transcriptional regulator [Candidatus Eisenbacteria bacterium]|nr:Lrp/AsnC family transcriptional regulator [Candidatus Eisenbacteria bacterium]
MPIRANTLQVLDPKDQAILDLVQRDGKMSQAEIARRVGLSTAAVNERLKKLEQAGVIRRYAALLDPRALGVQVTAFVEVFIEHPRHEAAFLEKLRTLDEVQECHHVTGEFSVFLKVRVRDMDALQDLLLNQLNGMEGVRQTRTAMVLSTVKEECYVSTGVKGEAS